MTALAKSIAVNGKGKYFGVSSSASGTAIVDALNAIFSEVQAVNSVFASTTLPVVGERARHQPQPGVHRRVPPGPVQVAALARHLKMYNLALNTATNTVFLADATNGVPPAVGAAPRTRPPASCRRARPASGPRVPASGASATQAVNGIGGASDKPDGDLVEKGGAAQQLRTAFPLAEGTTPARKLYTCTTGDRQRHAPGLRAAGRIPVVQDRRSRRPTPASRPARSTSSTRPVFTLTAYAPKNVTTVTDRLPLSSFTNTFSGIGVASMTNRGAHASDHQPDYRRRADRSPA
jgi:hypothetical protein